jgi:hypothetical protein
LVTSIASQRICPLALAVALVLAAGHASATTLTVDSNDDSPISTSCNLRTAIAAISAGTIVGSCSATGAFGTNDTIVFANTLVNTTVTLTLGQLPINKAVSIVGSGQTINANGGSPIFYVASAALTASHVTLTGGYIGSDGGAIYARNGAVTLRNATITNSSSKGNGGGIFAYKTNVALYSSTVSNNLASRYAGGIEVNAGSLKLSDSTVSGNSGAKVGAIYITNGGTATLTRSTIDNNVASCNVTHCNGNATNCKRDHCTGGIYGNTGSVTLVGCTVSNNAAAGIYSNAVSGGAYFWDTNANLVNSTISGNSAAGVVLVAGGSSESHHSGFAGSGLALINATVSANNATGFSAKYTVGGLLVGGYESGTSTLANTIASSNFATVPPSAAANSDLIGSAVTAQFSLLGSTLSAMYPGNGNVFSDAPGLGPLANNKGPTLTMALLSVSPALRAGNVSLGAFAGLPLKFDQRGAGFARTFNQQIDIGAFQDQGDRIFADGFESGP